jgi:hypothetical protein
MQKNKVSWMLLAAALALPACTGNNTSSGQGGASGKSSDAAPPGASGNSNAMDPGSVPGEDSAPVITPTELGAACQNDADCAGGLCITEHDRGWPNGFCSGSCDPSQSECQGTGKCFDIGQSQGLCVLPCKADSNDCRSGYACTDIMGDNSLLICLPACSADEQCSPSSSCDPIQRLCVAPEADCSNGQDDDGDGLVDCEDPKNCQGTPACASGATLTGHPCTANADCAAAGGDPACVSEAGYGFPQGS